MTTRPSRHSDFTSNQSYLPETPRGPKLSFNTILQPTPTRLLVQRHTQSKLESPGIRKVQINSSGLLRFDPIDSMASLGRQEMIARNSVPKRSQIKQEYLVNLINKHKNSLEQNIHSRDFQHVKRFSFLLKQASNKLHLDDLILHQKNVVKSLIDYKFHQAKESWLKNLLESLPLFDKQNILLIISVVLSNLWYPLEISFNLRVNSFDNEFNFFLLFLNFVDMILRLNKYVIVRGQIICDKFTIFTNYIEQSLFIDLLSNFAILSLMIFENELVITLSVLVYAICSLPKLIKRMGELSDFYNFGVLMRDILSLGNMIFIVVFIMHIVACIWHGVSVKSGLTGWVQAYGYENLPTFQIYQISFYWAAMTMTTVGYGDITPKNQYEYLCANLTMLVACIVFGYTMNRIGLLLTNIYMRNAEFKQTIIK